MNAFNFGDEVTVLTPNQPKKRGTIIGVIVNAAGILDHYLVLLHPMYREYTESRSLYISAIAVPTTNLQYS